MVGGGHGAFIGEVHRWAAALDGKIDLVCGAFSRNEETTLETGAALGLDRARLYASYEDMFRQEAALPVEERMEFVVIVTPNHLHFPIATAALKYGFHVLSDKPATLNLSEARELKALIHSSGLLYGLTHTYLGYPMVKQAQDMVRVGALGKIRKVIVEYPQGWLSRDEEASGNKQADWRTDPARAGLSGCMGDIGTHAHSLAEYVSGQVMTHVCADLSTFVVGRRLDDDGAVLFRMSEGVNGILMASQICAGEENGLKLRIYGDQGGLEWSQLEPCSLQVKMLDVPLQVWRAGTDKNYLCPAAKQACRLPGGHPEGYLEAFANLYKDFALQVQRWPDRGAVTDIPGIDAGLRGMAFIQAVVENSQSEVKWTPIWLEDGTE